MSKKCIVSIAAMCVLSFFVFSTGISAADDEGSSSKSSSKSLQTSDGPSVPRAAAPSNKSDKDDAAGKEWKSKVNKKIMKYLDSEGYRPSIDDDGDVSFKVEGLSYCILVDPGDKTFFRVLLPSIAKVEEDKSVYSMLAGAIVCKDIKVAKVLLLKNHVHVFVELFCADEDAFIAVLDRSIRSASVAREKYYETIKSLEEKEKK